jgi:hypothetical protein
MNVTLPSAFSWAATYHRDARRKSVFHAAVALCGISLAAAADHACTRAPCSAGTRPASIATTEMSASSAHETVAEETMKATIRSWRYLMTPLVFVSMLSISSAAELNPAAVIYKLPDQIPWGPLIMGEGPATSTAAEEK